LRLGQVSQLAKCRTIMNGQVGKHFAVNLHTRLFQAMNELAIIEAILARRCIDAADPQGAEIALAVAAVAVGIKERFEHRLICPPKEQMFGANLALGKFQNFLMPPMGINLWSGTGHLCFLLP
jgi:hypothetical protein